MAKTSKLHLLADANGTGNRFGELTKAACGISANYGSRAWYIASSPYHNDASRLCPKCAVARLIAETAPVATGA